MKTSSVLRFTALVAVLLASTNVDASDGCYNHLGGQPESFCGCGDENSVKVVMCIINSVASCDYSVPSVELCFERHQPYSFLKSKNNFVNFKIMNGENVSENGLIMNATLSWGKWQKGGVDVTTVNNTKFDRKQAASFTAMGSEGSAGPKGSFDIHESGNKIAVVVFNIPIQGQNMLVIKQFNRSYLCKHSGMTSSGSPNIEIICHKNK